MDSRLIFLHQLEGRSRLCRAGNKLPVESGSPARGHGGLVPKWIWTESAAEKRPGTVPCVARTVNRHRWVGRIYQGA